MSFITETQIAIERSIGEYVRASKNQQAILRVLAVINKRIGQVKFKAVLAELSHSDAFGGLKLQTHFSQQLKAQFAGLGLISVDREGIKISDHLADYLTRLTIAEHSFEEIIDAAEFIVPVEPLYDWSEPERSNLERQIRDNFYRQRYNHCIALLKFNKNPQQLDTATNQCLVKLCFYPFDQAIFDALPHSLQYQALATLLYILRRDLVDNSEVVSILSTVYQAEPDNDNIRLLLAEQYLLGGDFTRLATVLRAEESSSYGLQLQGCYQFLNADPIAAKTLFKQAIIAKNRLSRRKKQYIGGVTGLFYIMTLLQLGSAEEPSQLPVLMIEIDNQLADSKYVNNYRASYLICLKLAALLAAKQKSFNVGADPLAHHSNFFTHLQLLFSCLCCHWAGEEPNDRMLKQLVGCFNLFAAMKCRLFANIAAQLLMHHGIENRKIEQSLAANNTAALDICGLVKRKESWALALEQLIALDQSKGENNTPAVKESRLIWLFEPQRYGGHFAAKEQKLTKNGWSKGRTVALKRLYQDHESFNYLSDGDIKMCRAIKSGHSGGYYGREYFELTGYSALKAAAGLPNLYLVDDTEHPFDIVEAEPELLISQSNGDFLLSMANIPANYRDHESCYSLTREAPQRYRLVRYENKHLQIAAIVGEGGLVVPLAAKEQVLQSISAIAPLLNIQSDVTGIETGVEQVVADNKLYINIEPAGEGLAFECHVLPLGAGGPALSPGLGNPTFSMAVKGQRLGTTRDLLLERQQLELLMAQCPMFNRMIDNRLLTDRLDDALEALEPLEALCGRDKIGDNSQGIAPIKHVNIVLQWPKGKSFSLSKKLGPQHMQLAVTKQKQWFDLTGKLVVSDEQVIEFKTLLSLVSQSTSRFIRLDEQQILSLSDELRQRLQDLERMSESGKFHALASPLIDVATQGMRLKTLDGWQRQKILLQQAEELRPQLPSTLQAELRDYQIDGFDWASRLAHWGAGACLADDMGLGKTLQALAVILARAADGPTLVLAPTSVCFNWQQEAARFAPTLNIKMFGSDHNSIERRERTLEKTKPFDLVICSYGLLQRHGELLAKVNWQTIVADEAQALKNPLAKRTQAALALSGKFKMITTGTPIENNLTELWSLFRFINPGLLGAQKQFHKRFANIIESTKASEAAAIDRARQGLRKLIAPFILRRMKSQVLTELPARTEINLHVELSEQETALYEALRQQAIENLAQGDETPAQHHIKMLAEIMRLRRACCHPSLVMPDANIEGSKLRAFDNLIDELKQNNHKALVFSQFVGHLELLRQHLERKAISYQYLDGATPANQRRKAVNAFQAGQGDVFLISLKAGGSGLNLTAADYVIHMDPWWNPAVEDQASDRAHRMGQVRPVTIYRFIAKHTIEDKILALHRHKRDLANNLLEGNDRAGDVSAADMMALLQQQI